MAGQTVPSPAAGTGPPAASAVGGSTVLGIELLRLPPLRPQRQAARPGIAGLRAVTCASFMLPWTAGDPLGSLAAAVRLDPGDEACARRRDLYAGLAGPGFQIPPATRRALSVTMITSRASCGSCGHRRVTPGPGRPQTAGCGPPPRPPHCSSSAPTPKTPMPWTGSSTCPHHGAPSSLRDGVAFLGLVPDTGDNASFFAWGESYIRSLYTDVTLLAALERDALDDFANRLAHIGNRFEKSQPVPAADQRGHRVQERLLVGERHPPRKRQPDP